MGRPSRAAGDCTSVVSIVRRAAPFWTFLVSQLGAKLNVSGARTPHLDWKEVSSRLALALRRPGLIPQHRNELAAARRLRMRTLTSRTGGPCQQAQRLHVG